MVIWWEAMDLTQQVFAILGITSTVLLGLQVLLSVISTASDAGDGDFSSDSGLDGDGGFDLDTDLDLDMDIDIDTGSDFDLPDADGKPAGAQSSGLHIFTLQGWISFFAIFGWSGLLMLKSDVPFAFSLIFAMIFGFISMFLMAFIMKSMLKLQSDGTLDIRNALGKSGVVYLPVYPERRQAGKVSVMVQERLVELDAVTDEADKIPTGAHVTVVGITNRNTVVIATK